MSRTPRSKVIGSAVVAATAISALLLSPAHAHYDGPDFTPNLPVVGDTGGLAGPGPQISVYGGGVRLRGGTGIQIEVECSTSTEMGCSGGLVLGDARGRRVDSTAFELHEDQSEGLFLELPADAKRRAARNKGWRLTAAASGVDSLGRSAKDTAMISVWSRRGRRSR